MPTHLERDYARYRRIVGALRLKNLFKPTTHEAALVVLRADHVRECQEAIDKEIKALSQIQGRDAMMLAAEIAALNKAKQLIATVADPAARAKIPA